MLLIRMLDISFYKVSISLLSSIVITNNKAKNVKANNGVIVATDISKHIKVNNHVIVSSIVSKYFIM